VIQTKEEIISAFKTAGASLCQYIKHQQDELFEETPNGKWSAGQNLDHMIRSVKPLNLAYRLPNFGLRILFGKPNRPGRSFKEVVERYNTKLANGAVATGVFVPPVIKLESKQSLLKKLSFQNEKLSKALANCSEKKLDRYLLPHPLLGKITLREMMFFTIYHNEHHLKILKDRENVSA
jgi:hypothetical protein